jgi:hypothetical protein
MGTCPEGCFKAFFKLLQNKIVTCNNPFCGAGFGYWLIGYWGIGYWGIGYWLNGRLIGYWEFHD